MEIGLYLHPTLVLKTIIGDWRAVSEGSCELHRRRQIDCPPYEIHKSSLLIVRTDHIITPFGVVSDTGGFQHIANFFIGDFSPWSQQVDDLVPVIEFTVGPPCGGTSGTPDSLDLTGGFRFLEQCESPRSERISRTTRAQKFFYSFAI